MRSNQGRRRTKPQRTRYFPRIKSLAITKQFLRRQNKIGRKNTRIPGSGIYKCIGSIIGNKHEVMRIRRCALKMSDTIGATRMRILIIVRESIFTALAECFTTGSIGMQTKKASVMMMRESRCHLHEDADDQQYVCFLSLSHIFS